MTKKDMEEYIDYLRKDRDKFASLSKFLFFLILVGFITGIFVGGAIEKAAEKDVRCVKFKEWYRCVDEEGKIHEFYIITDVQTNTVGNALIIGATDCNFLCKKCIDWRVVSE